MIRIKFIFFIFLMAPCLGASAFFGPFGAVATMPEMVVYQALRMRADGVPYKYGGTSLLLGMDCSAFVAYVFKIASGRTLPRTVVEMSREGNFVAESNLRPSDVVFFKTTDQHYSHIGIYIGNGEFIHASEKYGQISLSKINASYWRKRFEGARRFIETSPET